MSENLDLSTLASRPPWRVVKIFRWLAILTAVLTLLGFIMSGILYLQVMALNSAQENTDTENAVSLDIADFLIEAAWSGLGLLFYAVVFWMLALVADKLDQLVWLKASEQDKLHIYNQRQKKKNAN